MKRSIAILSVLLFLLLSNVPVASAHSDVSFSFSFYDTLRPYGGWVNVSSYGTCWRPQTAGFIPYTNGHWIYTSYGPTWVGYEPWAWSVYHYGNWVFTAQFGWVWVPGYQWSPGNVVWAYGSDYIGWAPYSPGFSQFNAGLWIFIDRDYFGYSNYSRIALRRDTVRNLFDRRAVRIHSGRLDQRNLERITRHPVRIVRVQEREILADRHRARLVVPAGEEHVLQRVSQLSRSSRTNVTHTSNEKVKIERKVEVKQKSSGKEMYNQRIVQHTTKKEVYSPTRHSVVTHPTNYSVATQRKEVKHSSGGPSHSNVQIRSQEMNRHTFREEMNQDRAKSNVSEAKLKTERKGSDRSKKKPQHHGKKP